MNRPRFSNMILIISLAAIYFVGGKFGLMLAFVNASATAVWPPAGIALAAFLVLGYRMWPGVFLGALLVNMTTSGSLMASLGITVGNTLEGILGAYLVQRFANGCNAFERPKDVFKFVLFAGMMSTIVSATIGVTTLALSALASWADYGSVWLTWWLGDAGGDLIFAPLFILWSKNFHLQWRRNRFLEALLLLLTLFFVGVVVFGGWFPAGSKNYPLDFICVPILVWAAFRFGQRGTATTTFLLSGISLWGTLRGLGPFARENKNESLLLLQTFMNIAGVMTMALAAVISERKRVEEELRKAHDELELRVQGRTNELSRALVTLQDGIDKRQQIEEALRKSEAQLRCFVEANIIGVIVGNFQGKITEANDFFLQMVGYSREELHAGKIRWDKMTPPEWHPTSLRAIEELKKTGVATPWEKEYFHKDGHRIPILIGIALLEKSSEECICFVLDLTKRKKMEEALARQTKELERSNSELRQFAYVVSHDLKEPLRIVRSYTELLAARYKGKFDKNADEFVGFIVDGITRMQQLINDLLAYAEVGGDNRPLKIVQSDSALDHALANLEAATAESHAVVTHDPLPKIWADPIELSQLFQNLLSNAIKFRGKQHPRIHVLAEKKERVWLFSIRDNGIGIEPKYFDRIFVIFQRLHSRSEYPGTGIGLAICKKIVEKYGGRIWVESKLGSGSVFYFTIPL